MESLRKFYPPGTILGKPRAGWGVVGMLVKGDSRTAAVPQAERAVFIHEHCDKRDRNADIVTVSSSCPLPLRYLFSRMKHLEHVSQERGRRET